MNSNINNSVTGNNYVGHLILECMRKRDPDVIYHMDAATGEQETNSSVLSRTIRLARSFRRLGLRPGDVLALSGSNHLDLRIPYFAALLNGLPVAGVDPLFKYDEIKKLFLLTSPKIAFCDIENLDIYEKVANDLGIDVKIVTFREGDFTMAKLMETYHDNEPDDEFKPAEFDPDKVYAWLVSTSGTTGGPKLAAFKYSTIMSPLQAMLDRILFGNASKQNLAFMVSPPQWMSSYLMSLGMMLSNVCQLQTSNPDSVEHFIDVINEYKPTIFTPSPSLMSLILKNNKKCDLTCFKMIGMGGSKVYMELLLELRSRIDKDAVVIEGYGNSESAGALTDFIPGSPIGSCGVASPLFTLKLVDPETGKEITEPNKTGELLSKGPCFSEYYNNPEETAKAFTDDGFYRTGDLLYKDENGFYFFVDRMKMLIKYRNYHIIPTELEEVILEDPRVLEAGVTSVPHQLDGQRTVAVVVCRPGRRITAQEVKDLVAVKLSASKQLRGGVVFLDELPKTSTGKVARGKLRDIVLNAHRE